MNAQQKSIPEYNYIYMNHNLEIEKKNVEKENKNTTKYSHLHKKQELNKII